MEPWGYDVSGDVRICFERDGRAAYSVSASYPEKLVIADVRAVLRRREMECHRLRQWLRTYTGKARERASMTPDLAAIERALRPLLDSSHIGGCKCSFTFGFMSFCEKHRGRVAAKMARLVAGVIEEEVRAVEGKVAAAIEQVALFERIIDLLEQIAEQGKRIAESIPDYVAGSDGRRVWPVRQWD